MKCAFSVSCYFALFFLGTFFLNAQEQNINTVFAELKNDLSQAGTSTEVAHAHIRLGDFYKTLGIANEAVKHYHEALNVHKENDTVLVYVKNNLATIHLSLKQYETAQNYSEESLQLAESLHFEKGNAMAYALLGSVAEKREDFPLALNFQQKALRIFESLQDSTGLAQTHENIGSVYEDLEDYDQAKKYFKKAFEYAEQSPSDLKINIFNNIGDANFKSENFKTALHYTLQALKMARETNNGHQEESALKDLAELYAGMGDFTTAYRYMNEHALVNEAELQRKNTEQVSTLQVLYEVEERNAQVELLNRENEIGKARQRIFLLVGALVMLSLLGWFFYYKKKQQQEAKIQRYKQQLLQVDLDKKTAEEETLKREMDFKLSALTNYSLNLAHKNMMLANVSRTLTNLEKRNADFVKTKLKDVVKDIDSDLANEDEWIDFMKFFEQVHPDFFENLKKNASIKLSPAELRLCLLLRLNLSSKEIASILRITPDSVRVARYRLRKKLPLKQDDDLQSFLINL